MPSLKYFFGLLIATLLLAGCAFTKLGYNNLDLLLRWRLSDYVDFTEQQRLVFDRDFASLWDWHRDTQLRAYAQDLRALADEVGAGALSRPRVEHYAARSRAHSKAVFEQALPGAVRLLTSLSDQQVSELAEEIHEKIEDDAERYAESSPSERREFLMERREDGIKAWIGKPNVAQRTLIAHWAEQMEPEQPARIANASQDLSAFAALLGTRKQDGFELALRDYLTPPAEDSERGRYNARWREAGFLFWTGLSESLTPLQRERCRKRMLEWASDFEVLAARSG